MDIMRPHPWHSMTQLPTVLGCYCRTVSACDYAPGCSRVIVSSSCTNCLFSAGGSPDCRCGHRLSIGVVGVAALHVQQFQMAMSGRFSMFRSVQWHEKIEKFLHQLRSEVRNVSQCFLRIPGSPKPSAEEAWWNCNMNCKMLQVFRQVVTLPKSCNVFPCFFHCHFFEALLSRLVALEAEVLKLSGWTANMVQQLPNAFFI